MKSTIRNIPTKLLFVDHGDPVVQRDEPESVAGLVNKWDPTKVGVIEVSERADGRFHIVDGQHRFMASMQIGMESMTCKVHQGLSRPEEAELFLGLNNTKAVSVLDRWFTRKTANDPVVLDITARVEEFNWTINRVAGHMRVNAVAALESAWFSDKAGEALSQGIDFLLASYGEDDDVVLQGQFLKAAAWWFANREEHDSRTITALAKLSSKRKSKMRSPTIWLNNARLLQSMGNGTIQSSARQLLAETLALKKPKPADDADMSAVFS